MGGTYSDYHWPIGRELLAARRTLPVDVSPPIMQSRFPCFLTDIQMNPRASRKSRASRNPAACRLRGSK
jgi:hypothetical protein